MSSLYVCALFGLPERQIVLQEMQESVAGSAVGRSTLVPHDCGWGRSGGREEWTG